MEENPGGSQWKGLGYIHKFYWCSMIQIFKVLIYASLRFLIGCDI